MKRTFAEPVTGLNNVHADLLNFKTGFRTFADRNREDGENVQEKRKDSDNANNMKEILQNDKAFPKLTWQY